MRKKKKVKGKKRPPTVAEALQMIAPKIKKFKLTAREREAFRRARIAESKKIPDGTIIGGKPWPRRVGTIPISRGSG